MSDKIVTYSCSGSEAVHENTLSMQRNHSTRSSLISNAALKLISHLEKRVANGITNVFE